MRGLTTTATQVGGGLIGSTTFKQSGSIRMTTAKSFDFLGRLQRIRSTTPSAAQPVSSHAYGYNQLNQRNRAVLADGSSWAYEYDKLGQLTSGKRRWSASEFVPGHQYEYAYDDIGIFKISKTKLNRDKQ